MLRWTLINSPSYILAVDGVIYECPKASVFETMTVGGRYITDVYSTRPETDELYMHNDMCYYIFRGNPVQDFYKAEEL